VVSQRSDREVGRDVAPSRAETARLKRESERQISRNVESAARSPRTVTPRREAWTRSAGDTTEKQRDVVH
jgi:hypothetical protein